MEGDSSMTTPSRSTRLPAWLAGGPLYSWSDLKGSGSIPPASPGVYAWWFNGIPASVPTEGCVRRGGRYLLYIGIAPSRLGGAETLRSRIRYHFTGNAEGSTLRLTLGCLLGSKLGTVLRRIGSSGRRTFVDAEATLTAWMLDNAAVVWRTVPTPWVVETQLMSRLSLPLNLDQNNTHPFAAKLKALRSEARRRADRLPVLS